MSELRWGGAGPVVGVLLAAFLLALSAAEVEAQSESRVQVTRQLGSEEELDVRIRYGAGHMALRPASSGTLYRMTLRYDEARVAPLERFSNGRLLVGTERASRRGLFRGVDSEGELDLALNRRIPMDLSLELGAVRADLELGGLRLRTLNLASGASDAVVRVSEANPEEMDLVHFRLGASSLETVNLGRLNARELRLDVGAGRVRLDLGGLGREETRIQARLGAGDLQILVPEGVAIRLTRSAILSQINAPELEHQNGAYYSTDWDYATQRVRIEVESAFGNVTISRSPGEGFLSPAP